MKKQQILGIIRHTLTFVGGILVIKGVANDITIQEVSGSLISLISVIWSVLSKKD